MAPQKFKAKSIQAAVKKIKDALGPEAMIVSTRRIAPSVHDPYNKELFEVTAVAHQQGMRTRAAEPKPSKRIINKYLMDPVGGDELSEDGSVPDASSGHDDGQNGTAGDLAAQTMAAINADDLHSELAGIKELLYLLNETSGFAGFFQDYPECLTLYKKLIRAGISEKQVQRFMMRARHFDDDIHPSAQMITKRVLESILATIKTVNPFRSRSEDEMTMEPGPRQLAAFVGPTGAGKTTTIAKLAAELSLKRKQSVGLISIDSYRVGALEQLKIYSSIMGLPCLPAFSRQDLAIAVQKMRHRDVILIDTAGHGHLDEKRMAELAQMMGGGADISCHLVLSVTTNRKDMKDAAKHFNLLKPETYIFTKIDETRGRGVMIDQILDLSLPISFVTNGQRVPEDIMTASPKKILDLILKQEN